MKTKRTATADSDAGSYDVPEDDFEAFDDSDDEEKTKAAIKMQVRQCGEEFFLVQVRLSQRLRWGNDLTSSAFLSRKVNKLQNLECMNIQISSSCARDTLLLYVF